LELLESDKAPDIIKTMRQRNQLYTKVIPVIPPDLRPMFSKYKSDDINKFYIALLKYISKHSIGTRTSLLYSLTRFAYDLFLYTYEHIPKKSGLIRQALLGKETDFSARTVIVPDPTLPVDTISISKFIKIHIGTARVIGVRLRVI